jgi:acyl carrier protein
MTQNANLISEIKTLLIDLLNLRHLNPDDLTADTLLHDDLNLDSIDILELVVGIENKYGIKIENAEKGKEIFKSLGSIAGFVLGHQSS